MDLCTQHNDGLLVFGQTLCRIALILRLDFAYPGLRILVFEADVIPFLPGRILAQIDVDIDAAKRLGKFRQLYALNHSHIN